jgi:hypothetical protein
VRAASIAKQISFFFNPALPAGVPAQAHSRAGEFNHEMHEPHKKILNAKKTAQVRVKTPAG